LPPTKRRRAKGDFRCGEPLAALGITMPPWPGEGEAVFVPGKWDAGVS
jgi:mannose-6-phosphate isomerase-like protein (cupin superfamily)